ncbi:uncharacterized protein LOC132716623 [Ruditapes philippinarum]|uniref:uncharacterized protein LOC132716623 n=1 Tax=Ruditapes philippinarum TaxID=129788 RepID=UPI00295A634D|nr:uncharacterized protein LOC132716623 [Ruditapes philippinarum]
MDDIEKSPTRPGRSIDLSNSEQISLFNTTLERALDRQRDIILDQIEARIGTPAKKSPADKFQFKSEGLQIQFDFNVDRIDTLQKIDNFCNLRSFDSIQELVKQDIKDIQHRNKLLKIADKHGWLTVKEYDASPLADNDDDATKLRGAITRATQARRYSPYAQSGSRQQRQFSSEQPFQPPTYKQQSFRWFTPGNATVMPRGYVGGSSQQQRFPLGSCFICHLGGHYAKACPYVQRSTVPPRFSGYDGHPRSSSTAGSEPDK